MSRSIDSMTKSELVGVLKDIRTILNRPIGSRRGAALTKYDADALERIARLLINYGIDVV